MNLLHESEFDIVLSLLGKVGQEVDFNTLDEGRPYLEGYGTQDFINKLDFSGLISIKGVRINYRHGPFLDAFLRNYSSLVLNNEKEKAISLAKSINLDYLNETLEEQKTLADMRHVIEEMVDKDKGLMETNFYEDLVQNINIRFVVKSEIKEYFNQYLQAFQKDELQKPPFPSKNEMEYNSYYTYFKKEFYRYKRQRDIFINLISKKLEIQNPKKITIIPSKEPLFEHLNFNELEECLEQEGIILSGNWEMISNAEKGILSSYGVVLSVDEKKINKISVNSNVAEGINLLSENGIGYIKFRKYGSKIKIGKIDTRKFRLLRCLMDPLGIAKNIDIVFDAIRVSKDETDHRLEDNYLSASRKIELIEYTLKELQKINGLKGKIKLKFINNKKSVQLILNT